MSVHPNFSCHTTCCISWQLLTGFQLNIIETFKLPKGDVHILGLYWLDLSTQSYGPCFSCAGCIQNNIHFCAILLRSFTQVTYISQQGDNIPQLQIVPLAKPQL